MTRYPHEYEPGDVILMGGGGHAKVVPDGRTVVGVPARGVAA